MRTTILLTACLLAIPAVAAFVAPANAAPQAAAHKPDLADLAAGTWTGSVTSDVRGSSRSGVTITVTRVGHNLVEVRSDYSRIPTVRIPLTQPADSITNASGGNTFLIERKRDPNRLDLYIDQASLIVRRR